MEWILIAIVVLLIFAAIWFIVEYRRDEEKDHEVFNEYIERKRRLTYRKKGTAFKTRQTRPKV